MIIGSLTFVQWIAYLSEWLGVIAVALILSLSPRFKRAILGFRYARRDGMVALSLMLFILVFAVLFYGGMLNFEWLKPLGLATATLPVQQMALAIFGVLPFGLALLLRQQPIRSAGWGKAGIKPGLQMGFALALITLFLRNRAMNVLDGIDAVEIAALGIALVTALAEESIFRGYIQLRLTWWLGERYGWIATAILYTIWRLPAWAAQPMPILITQLVITLSIGLICGWVMRKTGSVAATALYRTAADWALVLG